MSMFDVASGALLASEPGYTVFGFVADGSALVDQIADGDVHVLHDDRTTEPVATDVQMLSATVEPPLVSYTPGS